MAWILVVQGFPTEVFHWLSAASIIVYVINFNVLLVGMMVIRCCCIIELRSSVHSWWYLSDYVSRNEISNSASMYGNKSPVVVAVSGQFGRQI